MTRTLLPPDTPTRIAFVMIAGLLLLRLAIVLVSPLELYADEAQYWRWSTGLDWGYYSKPPMIAWIIHLTTSWFGDSESAIRLAAPFAHTMAAIFICLLARQMFGPRAALIATAAYLLMPGIILSSTIISTDGVLFPFWCAALYLAWQLRNGGGWGAAVGLGAMIGLGLLSKYAMVYFVLGLGLSVLIDSPSRRALLSWRGLAVLAMALLVIAPHLAWNAAHDFQTFGHTVDNANLGGELFNLENLPTYLADQMGVFGPVSFLALVFGLVFMRDGMDAKTAAREHWLACFIVPVLVIIAVQAVLSRAHANWAATAYPAACILVASLFTRAQPRRATWLIIAAVTGLALLLAPALTLGVRAVIALAVAGVLLGLGAVSRWRPVGLFWAGIGLHLSLAGFLAALMLGPPAWTHATGMDNTMKRTRGWQALADQLVAEAERIQPTAILVDEREIWHGLDYYTRGRLSAPLILWRYHAGPQNFAEQRALNAAVSTNVLVASYRPNRRARIDADFARFTSVGEIGVDLGTRSNGCPIRRDLRLYRASGFQPQTRDQAWIDRYRDYIIDAPPPCPAPADGS